VDKPQAFCASSVVYDAWILGTARLELAMLAVGLIATLVFTHASYYQEKRREEKGG